MLTIISWVHFRFDFRVNFKKIIFWNTRFEIARFWPLQKKFLFLFNRFYIQCLHSLSKFQLSRKKDHNWIFETQRITTWSKGKMNSFFLLGLIISSSLINTFTNAQPSTEDLERITKAAQDRNRRMAASKSEIPSTWR